MIVVTINTCCYLIVALTPANLSWLFLFLLFLFLLFLRKLCVAARREEIPAQKFWARILYIWGAKIFLFNILFSRLIFVGVGCASVSTTFGEITFLSLTTFYSRKLSLLGWGSGTGAAGTGYLLS